VRKPHTAHLVAASVTVAFTVTGLWVLWHGYPPDDAYILYTYAEHLAGGDGIVYNTGGPRTEGATDFLWMVALAGISATGLDIALAALALNGVGVYLLTWLLVDRFAADKGGFRANLHLILLAAVILGSRLTQASLAGFSTFLYAAFCVLLLCLYQSDQRRQLLWVPVVAILIGLIRPDGVFIGVVATILGLWRAWNRPFRSRYLAVAGTAGMVGVVYFLWRYSYFGLPLPLPLYVKASSSALLEGLPINILWLVDSVFFLIVAPFGAEHLRLKKRDYLILWLPFLALLVVLSFAHQSQNIAFRFQAPALAALIFVFAAFLRDSFAAGESRGKAIFATVLAVAATGVHGIDLLGARYMTGGMRFLVTPGYADVFAGRLQPLVGPSTRIAVSEAGRIAFWTNAQVYDLVGLNTAEVALNGLDPSYLTQISPDIILVHTVGTLRPPREVALRADVVDIDIANVRSWLSPGAEGADLATMTPEQRAPLAVYHYLFENPQRYRLILVRHNGLLQHLFAVDGTIVDTQAFARLLRQSADPENFIGYLGARMAAEAPP